MSERRGSNPPPEAWKATALPNELLSLVLDLLRKKLKEWGRMDSNHRKRKLADLQSAPFGHSGTPPFRSTFSQ